jgi:hypothetical protein
MGLTHPLGKFNKGLTALFVALFTNEIQHSKKEESKHSHKNA